MSAVFRQEVRHLDKNGTERRRNSRQLERQGLARVTIVINLDRVGDMLREERLIDRSARTTRRQLLEASRSCSSSSMPRAAIATFDKCSRCSRTTCTTLQQ